MSENSKFNAGESNTNGVKNSDTTPVSINQGRRALARAVMVGAPVILTLASKPSLAAINNPCSVSGQLSGNMSAAGSKSCENPNYKGLTPEYWGQRPSEWKNCFYLTSEIKPGTKFHPTFYGNMFGTENMLKVIQDFGKDDRYLLGAHTVAALLNSCRFGKAGYGYSSDEVVALFKAYAYGNHAVELRLAFEYLNGKG